MKAIKFFVTILLMAVMPMLIVSCKERNEPTNNTTGGGSTGPNITASIVGDWELLEITKTNSEGATLDKNKIEGESWTFSSENILTVGSVKYDYTLEKAKLTTEYAKVYKADFFTVQVLTDTDLKLSASYIEEDKVGDRKITNTLKFKRLSE